MPVLLPTRRVLALCNPFRTSPWDVGRVTRRMVRGALRSRRLRPAPVVGAGDAAAHASRIAFLVEQGWKDSIEIDVGIPALGCWVRWPVQDGNHRLAAASFRGDSQILAMVGGDLDYARDLFGVECEEPQP